MTTDNLTEQILTAWRVHNAINVLLLRAIPKKGFQAVPLGSRGRNVAQQFVHMHKVRAGWLRFNGAPLVGIRRFAPRATPGRAQLQAAFRASGRAVETFLRTRLQEDRRMKWFTGQPVRWMAYLISHESHHRGQIALALKQNGMRLPEKVAINGLWYTWYWGDV